MKKETIEDELLLLKIDIQNLQKNTRLEILSLDKIIRDMREHINYLYEKLELKALENRN